MSVTKMDKFYILDHSTDHKVIGSEYPQCTGVLKGYDNEYENPFSLYYFAHQKGKKIDYQPDLSAIKIGLKTKLTDCISCSLGPGNDLVVSSKFKNTLKTFKVSPLQLFKCVLNRKEEQFNYWWIHYIYSLEEQVDYMKSTFAHSNEKLHAKLMNVKSYEGYRSFYDNDDTYGLVMATKTVIDSPPLDFFVVGQFNQKHYASERLKDALEIRGITGVTFKEATDVYFSRR
jgi:hypothetical protein